MLDYSFLFARQAEASAHVHFVYELAASQLVFVNDAYRAVLHGEPDQANTALPALLARLHPDDRPRLAEYWTQRCQGELRELETTSRESVKMIRDFINIEFLTSANSDLKRDRVDVGAVLREPLDQLSTKSIAHHFAYTLPTAPLYANLDVNKFTQVLLNLVSKALKFKPDAGTSAWSSSRA